MNHCDLSAAEQQHRGDIAAHTRKMILTQLTVEDEDDTFLMTNYHSYYLQISFSKLHPLMVFCLAKVLERPSSATHWLDTEMKNLSL